MNQNREQGFLDGFKPAEPITSGKRVFTCGHIFHALFIPKLLSAYCHFSVVYRRTPVGLPIPPSAEIKDEALNRLLQDLNQCSYGKILTCY